MSTIAEERVAIADTIQNALSELHVYPYWTNNIQDPALMVKPGRYSRVSKDTGGIVRRYELELLVAARDNEEAQRFVDEFLEDSGPRSIREVIEADPTLGSVVDMCIYDGWEQYGGRRTEVQVYIGAIITLEVWAS